MKRILSFLTTAIVGAIIFGACDSRNSLSDPEQTHFLKFYGGDGEQTGDDFVVLPNGDFILFGTTTPSGTEKVSQWYLVRATEKGVVIWEKRFGNPVVSETASDIELTSDGNLVAVGNVFQTPTNRDVKVMTFTPDGVPIDSAVVPIYSSPGVDAMGDEDAASITEISGGFIIAGSTSYVYSKGPPPDPTKDSRDAIHLRLNKNLTLYQLGGWPATPTYGHFSDDVSKKIFLSSGEFYVMGYSNAPAPLAGGAPDNFNVWYYRLGLTGGSLPENYVGLTSENEKTASVAAAPTASGVGYLLSGISFNQAGAGSIFVAGLRDPLVGLPSDQQFIKTLSISIGTNLTEKTAVFASQQSGFFYVLANEKSFNDNQNWLLMKFNNDGSAAWSLPIIFGGEGPDACGGVQELADGRLALIGTMRTGKPDAGEFKMTLIKVNHDGKLSD